MLGLVLDKKETPCSVLRETEFAWREIAQILYTVRLVLYRSGSKISKPPQPVYSKSCVNHSLTQEKLVFEHGCAHRHGLGGDCACIDAGCPWGSYAECLDGLANQEI